MTRFRVHVVPRSKTAGPDGRYGGVPRLRVRAGATGGCANDEAVHVLARLLGAPVRLEGGARSRRKTFSAELERAEVDRRLRRAFGD